MDDIDTGNILEELERIRAQSQPLLRTAEKNGETPTKTLDKFIKGKGSLYREGGEV
jgi:hypothetical protein